MMDSGDDKLQSASRHPSLGFGWLCPYSVQMRIYSERGCFHDHRERAVVRGVKENLCYIAFEYDTELTSTAERSDYQIHMLSDRNIITVGAERFRCECFFPAKRLWQRSQWIHDTSSQDVM